MLPTPPQRTRGIGGHQALGLGLRHPRGVFRQVSAARGGLLKEGGEDAVGSGKNFGGRKKDTEAGEGGPRSKTESGEMSLVTASRELPQSTYSEASTWAAQKKTKDT